MKYEDAINLYMPSSQARARVSRLIERFSSEAQPKLRALVVGAGVSGRAAAELLLAKGAQVAIADDRAIQWPEQDPLAGCELGPLTEARVAEADLVVLSPGVPRTRPELQDALTTGKLVGEVELASWFVSVPMVGITGTNGKSTTTALVAHILGQAIGDRVFAGGNLGEPLSRLALSPQGRDVAVVELSSYQLESIVEAKFRVACWINLAPDHTDRYPDIEHYAAAKRRLMERRSVNGTVVLNAKDPWCAQAGLALGGSVRWFAATPTSDLAGPMGTVLATPTQAVRTHGQDTETYTLDGPNLIGVHNKANALAAIECARLMDVPVEAVQAGLSTYVGLAHRLELIRTVDDVRFFNDSKATNIASAVTALAALDRPIWLIAGGLDKGAPWAPLVEAARGKVQAVLTIGAAAEVIAPAFSKAGIEVVDAQTLDRALELAAQRALPGHDVVLSPACASFDQFKNFEARGEAFRAWVTAYRSNA